jgi:DNA-binding MarR family transcriptional regulator
MARTLVFHEAVAERLGINATDLKCLELAAGEEAISPGRLAELAGLTTGAVTGVLDRLERARIVRREADPTDRRRVVVRLIPERAGELSALYAPLLTTTAALAAAYDSSQRAALDGYLRGAARVLEQETVRLRVAARGGMVGDTFVAPLAGAVRGRLLFASGAPRLSVHAIALGQQARMVAETSASRLSLVGVTSPDELVRARFGGPLPDIGASDGTVTVRYRRRPIDFRTRSAEIALNPGIPWSIDVEGGLTDLIADVSGIRFTGLEVRGGANHLRLRLPRPEGTVRLVFAGGASEARFDRPAGTAVALRVRGLVSHLRFDGRRVESISDTSLQSDDFGGAADRYEIELTSASQVTVGTAVRP